MANPPDDPWSDARIEQLVRFDESLRLGRDPAPPAEASDAEVIQTQEFLRRLQTVWNRTAQKIGPYVLIRNLGQGSLGPCYLVEDGKTRRPYVLKTLWPDLGAQAAVRQLLLQETKALQQLVHVDIAALREVRAVGAFCCVVSEYCPGPSLAQWRRTKPQPLTWEVAAHCGAKLAEVFECAHRRGIVHGNLKPTNLFLPAEGEVTPQNLDTVVIRIADFGLAKVIQETRLPALGGLPWPMPQYLAPEQLSQRRRTTEPASDLYALGVLLYELLTGRSPVKGATREEVFTRTRETMPPPLRQYCTDAPQALDALVLACLDKHPRNRPATAQHLADSLRAILPALKPTQPAWWKQWLGWM